MTPAELPRALGRSFHGFFGRHPVPRPVQLEATGPLLAGRDVLVSAPSAAGKTEAYCAPLVERLLQGGWDAPAILVVSPTRALAGDLRRRIEGPLGALDVSLGLWTGERKEALRGGLRQVVVLTPESLDSRLSRDPRSLDGVRAVVLDEIHVLDGTPRGDQLRVLVSRLRRLAPSLQVVAVSATTADPEGVARRYLRDAVVVRDASPRPIRSRIVDGASPARVAEEVELLLRDGARKVIVFTNSRKNVERYAAVLGRTRALGGLVIAHHGSLSQRVREAAERRLLSAPRAVCVATMTLEIGVDVGDVDAVGLVAPPPDVASLVQRAGRSGRRGRAPRLLCFARDRGDGFRFRVMLELARRGELAADPYAFRPSVLVQQAMSIMHQNPRGWVGAAAVRSRLDPGLAAAWDEERIHRVLEGAAEAGWLVRSGRGRFRAGDRCESRWPLGRLHSNIDSPREVEVVDSMTGETLGRVAGHMGRSPLAPPVPGDGGMRLAGRSRQVLSRGADRIVVGRDAAGESPTFSPRGAPVTSMALARAMAARLGIVGDAWPVVLDEDGAIVFHFLGTAAGELITAAIRTRAGRNAVVARGPYAVMFSPGVEPFVPDVDVDELEDICSARRGILSRVLGMGPYQGALPDGIAGDAVAGACGVSTLADRIAGAHLDSPPPGADLQVLTCLCPATGRD